MTVANGTLGSLIRAQILCSISDGFDYWSDNLKAARVIGLNLPDPSR
jgi:hypothetical protein